jgi:hypothetical protein
MLAKIDWIPRPKREPMVETQLHLTLMDRLDLILSTGWGILVPVVFVIGVIALLSHM